jgi:HlyD family type I secretion membrane fusion protein
MSSTLTASALPAPAAVPLTGSDIDLMRGHLSEAGGLDRRAFWLIAAGVLPVAAWLALAPLSSAVLANGHVKVDQNRTVVQHAEGGTVQAVFVRDGQRVRAGEPLMELGDVAVSADRERLAHRLLAERAGAVRLQAEQARTALVWPAELAEAARNDPALADQLSKEQSLFAARREALTGQTALLQQQRSKVEQEKLSLGAQIDRAQESIAAQKRELATHSALVKDGFITANRVTQLEASVADYGARTEERRTELVRADQRLVELDLKQRSLDSDYRQQAADQLKLAVGRIQELEQELRKASDVKRRQVIVAPADGEVIGLRVTHAGTVIAPREAVAEVVPSQPKLQVEARVRPEDIGRVQNGQRADLRFTAYAYRATHMVPGSVSYVSADRLVETQTQQPYYTVRIEVDAQAVADATGGEKLVAGMPAEVYLRGADRTPLEYLLDPIANVLRRAGRER